MLPFTDRVRPAHGGLPAEPNPDRNVADKGAYLQRGGPAEQLASKRAPPPAKTKTAPELEPKGTAQIQLRVHNSHKSHIREIINHRRVDPVQQRP